MKSLRKIMMGALCLNLLACQHTSQTRDVLEVILPTGTEGFVEVTFGELAERVDTFPLVDGRLVMEKEGLPVDKLLKKFTDKYQVFMKKILYKKKFLYKFPL